MPLLATAPVFGRSENQHAVPATDAGLPALLRQCAGLMQALPDLLTVIDSHGVLAYVSPSSKDLLGLESDGMVGRQACEFMAASELSNCSRWFVRARLVPDGSELVHRMTRHDGTYAWFETRLRPLAQHDGAGGSVMAVSRDISERIEAEQRVTAMTQMWTHICDVIREGVLVISGAGVVVAANRVASSYLGVAPHDLIGSTLGEHVVLVAADGRPIPCDQLPSARALRTHAATEQSLACQRHDGTTAWLHCRAVPLSRPGGAGTADRVVVFLESAVPQPEGSKPKAEDITRGAEIRNIMTPRELEVLRLLADGLDVRAASVELGISVHTVRDYVKSLMRKLDVRSQLQAVVLAMRTGLLD
jgi:PAS domain S-box-containing protein